MAPGRSADSATHFRFLRMYIEAPIIPKNRPATDDANEKKLRKKLDSRIPITIKNGSMAPSKTKTKPSRTMFLGVQPCIFI